MCFFAYLKLYLECIENDFFASGKMEVPVRVPVFGGGKKLKCFFVYTVIDSVQATRLQR